MTTSDQPSKHAQELLGEWDVTSDWKLEPLTHAQRLTEPALALSNILKHSAIQGIMVRFDDADKVANEQQQRYKTLGTWEVYLATGAALLGAIVLMMTDSSVQTVLTEGIRYALIALQLVSAAALIAVEFLQRQRNTYTRWQKARALAETARIELFETVCGLTERKWPEVNQPESPPLLLLQLEYFLRYQFGVQIAYYKERGAQHRMAAEKYVGIGAIITFFAALAAGALSTLQIFGDIVSIAALVALAAPLLLTAQTSLSRLHQDERNAARYEITFRHLQRAGDDMTDVRAAAAAGDITYVHQFIRRVNEVISVEHSQWLLQQQENETGHQS